MKRLKCQLERCQRDGPYLGVDFPWLRTDRLFDGKVIYCNILTEGETSGYEKE